MLAPLTTSACSIPSSTASLLTAEYLLNRATGVLIFQILCSARLRIAARRRPSQQIFHIPEAEPETVIPPDGVTDDLRRKPITVVAGRCRSVTLVGAGG